MFDHADVIKSSTNSDLPGHAPFMLAEFDQYDFEQVYAEQNLQIFIGDKRYFASPLTFWLAVIVSALDDHWRSRYFNLGYTAPLTPEARQRQLHHFTAGLTNAIPSGARLQETPVRSLEIGIDHCDQAILSEYAREYVAIRWYSTA